MHVKNLHWIVIEDANATVPAVERILQRSRIPYTYFYTLTKPGFPSKHHFRIAITIPHFQGEAGHTETWV